MPNRKQNKKKTNSRKGPNFSSRKMDPNCHFSYIPELSVDTVGGVPLSMAQEMLKSPYYRQQTSLHSLLLHWETPLASDVSGSITNVFADNPSSSPDWVNCANTFDKYRVIAFSIHYLPSNRYSKTTTICQPLVVLADRDDLANLTSYSQATENESARELTLEDPWTFTTSAQNGPSLEFRDALSSTNFNFIKLFSTGNSVSTIYGRVLVTYLVQFQGLGRG